jgi:hypothetical protein
MDNIIREAIVAFVVTKRESDLDGATIVTITPASLSEDPLDVCEVELTSGEELVTVLPAPAESYRVIRIPNTGPCSFLGYEFKGAESPVGMD